jgi:hypothetical protein
MRSAQSYTALLFILASFSEAYDHRIVIPREISTPALNSTITNGTALRVAGNSTGNAVPVVIEDARAGVDSESVLTLASDLSAIVTDATLVYTLGIGSTKSVVTNIIAETSYLKAAVSAFIRTKRC